MKKFLGSILIVLSLVLLIADNSQAACSWGGSWNTYTLTNTVPSINFEFVPGYAGEHKIETNKVNPFEVFTEIYWWSNAQPSWHLFVQTWSEGVYVLNAGSADVKFRIVFTKDQMKDGNYKVDWRYCMAY